MKFALIGNPNSGKTTLFNTLTGSTAHVGNWPGVTVDKHEGTYKKLGEKIEIVDLPGIYSLSPYSPEEIVSRKFIVDEKPDCVINIVDATNLERNLYLTTQLLEIDVPIVIALNMADVIRQSGDKIDILGLEKTLGIPVVEISALKKTNIDELMQKAYETAKKPRKSWSVLSITKLSTFISIAQQEFNKKQIDNDLFRAIKLIEREEELKNEHADVYDLIKDDLQVFINENDDIEGYIADKRYNYITDNLSKFLQRKTKIDALTKSDKIDKVMTHKVWGIPIFLAIMFAVFHVTFSEDFLYLQAIFGLKINNELLCKILQIDAGGALPSFGVWLQSWTGWATGSLIELVGGWLESAPDWVSGLICDGLLSGLDAIFSFLPQILLLFLFLSILEDSGYMSRVAFIMDRAFRKFGLSGKAFMPLLMCFGCGVPGVMATKTLENRKERIITMLISPFFSCGAKLPIWATFASLLFGGKHGDLIVFSIYIIGIVVAIIASILLKHTLFKGESSAFLMELPAYRRPQCKNTILHLWEKLKHYLYRAATVIAGAIVIIWFLSNFDFDVWNGLVVDMSQSILGRIGNAIKYLFYPLGFASGEYGWMFVVAIFTGLIAKEMVVSTMGALAGMEGDALEIEVLTGTPIALMIASISPAAAFSFMAFNLLSVPCMAMVAAVYGEVASGKLTWLAIGFWLVTAYIVSLITYWYGTLIATCWWAALIIGVIAVVIVIIAIILKVKKGKALKEAK